MSVPQTIVLTSIVGTLLATVSFVLGNIRTEAKKRGRIYERIDEHKEHCTNTFVTKEVCNILHQEIKEDMKEIKTDVKKLLTKNGIS